MPFLGVAALASGPKRHDGGDLWVIASAVLWLVAAAVLTQVVRPAERTIRAAGAAGAAGAAADRSAAEGPGRPDPTGAAGGTGDPGRLGTGQPGQPGGFGAVGLIGALGGFGRTPAGDPDPEARLRSAAKAVMMGSLVTDVIFVIALALMVAQPG